MDRPATWPKKPQLLCQTRFSRSMSPPVFTPIGSPQSHERNPPDPRRDKRNNDLQYGARLSPAARPLLERTRDTTGHGNTDRLTRTGLTSRRSLEDQSPLIQQCFNPTTHSTIWNGSTCSTSSHQFASAFHAFDQVSISAYIRQDSVSTHASSPPVKTPSLSPPLLVRHRQPLFPSTIHNQHLPVAIFPPKEKSYEWGTNRLV